MNYLAHGFRHVADPWFLAGTAVPDWLRVLARRRRLTADRAAEFAADPDPRAAALARGALQHHRDDVAFHASAAFRAASDEIAALVRPIRDATSEAQSHGLDRADRAPGAPVVRGAPRAPTLRPSFVAHLLVESLLDAEITRRDPPVLDAYYAALATLPPDDVEAVVSRMTPAPAHGLADLVRRFVAERFVADYAADARLVRRLDAVFRRVRQPPLGAPLVALVPAARAVVAHRVADLLTTSVQPDGPSG